MNTAKTASLKDPEDNGADGVHDEGQDDGVILNQHIQLDVGDDYDDKTIVTRKSRFIPKPLAMNYSADPFGKRFFSKSEDVFLT
jgi:hypothetical protein